jgi:hypothetical protein
MELPRFVRAAGVDYALSDLNRGLSLATPFGFKDGILIENRYYFGSADKYDVGRLSFVSLGYYPTKSLVGGNGEDFHPGLFARAYLTYDLPFLNSYLYGDAKYTAEGAVKPRLLEFDTGWAFWPAPGSADTELGVLMEPEVCHGETEVYTRVQA